MPAPKSLLTQILGALAIFSAVLILPALVGAQTAKTYIYDELGRLRAVVDPAGDTAVYTYDAVGNLLSISRRLSSLVSIIDFIPKSGPVGTTVTISGTGFSTTPSQNTVTFNGVAATVTSSTATQIATSVPTGATTGPIGVTSPGGSATSTTPFTVSTAIAAPTITGFTPTIGTPGTAVTITGTNFDTTPSNNDVRFNISYATVSSSTATTIATNVPNQTGSGRISVGTPLGEAVSSADFFIPPSPYAPTDIQFTGRMAFGESKIVTIDTPNKKGLVVFDGTTGQQVSLKMTSVSSALTSSHVLINDPQGIRLAPATGPGYYVGTAGLHAGYAPSLPTTGTYTIVVSPDSTYTGSMTPTLSDDVVYSTSIGGPAVNVTTTSPGRNARLTFSGTAGQTITTHVTNNTMGCIWVELYQPNTLLFKVITTWACASSFNQGPVSFPTTVY